MAVHVAAQLHLSQGVLRALLENPHVHVLHVVLDKEQVRLVEGDHESDRGRAGDKIVLGLVDQSGLEVKL